VSEDCGQTRTLVYLKGGEELATAPDFSSDRWVPASSEWRTESISDLPLNFNGDLSVLFENRGRFGQPIYIDNIRVESTTGIAKNAGTIQIKAYPNPVTDNLFIDAQGFVGLVRIQVQDMQGRIIQTEYQSGEKFSLTIKDLPQGLYSVSLRDKHRSDVIKIVKK
jgi:hypothetical protein